LHALDLVSNELLIWDEARGLPNSFVNGILPEGDSCIWVSTDNGLARLSLKSGRVAQFFQEDGLPANEFNRISFHAGRNGQLYFGGLNGIVSFQPDPAFIWDRGRRQSKLLLTDFSKFDGDIDSMISIPVETENPTTIHLSWRDKFFTFRFALADYGNPRENRYSYRLRGFETEWSAPTHEPTARYNNIPAGDYVFEVRAASGNNAWGGQVLTVPLRIEQAYFKSLWFIGLCGLFLVAIIYGIMRYRIYTIRQREKYLEQQVQVRTEELEEEKQKSDDLLLNILPAQTAEELKSNGSAKAQRFESATVMFSDFVGFTNIAEQLPPEELVKEIDYCFRAFDEIMEIYGIEKIKTIGDAYMCAGGLGITTSETPVKVVRAALEMQAFMEAIAVERKAEGRPYFEARIGIHTGPVVAGIVGIKKFAYDIWGDTVNIAARVEDNGKPGKVNISLSTYEEVKHIFSCTPRGKIKVKNRGDIDMYFVNGLLENDPRPSAAPGTSSPKQ
jgi:class 3 adenylate cyclase